MKFSDNFFKKIETKTSINKDTILNLANKLSSGDMKDEAALKDVISEISKITGKEVSKEKQDKIISAIVNDKVPSNLDRIVDQ